MKIIELLQSPAYAQKNILEKILCYKLGLTQEALFIETDREVDETDLGWIITAYHEYVDQKKPLEYIIGSVEFLGIHFEVTPATLIPRPETEYMIVAVHEFLTDASPVTLIDVGTGCGVLGISVLCHDSNKIHQAFLTELSKDALAVAERNYHRLQNESITMSAGQPPKVTLLISDLLGEEKLTNILKSGVPLLIVANLPYIPDQTFDNNVEDNVKKQEPRMAFVGGDDGLDLYRKMFDQIISTFEDSALSDLPNAVDNISIHPSDRSSNNTSDSTDSSIIVSSPRLTMFLEMMTRQIDLLREAYQNVFTFEEVKTFHFNIRIVKATLIQDSGNR